MRLFILRLLCCFATAGILSACGWNHPHKARSYDRSISDEDQDPTYHAAPERADEEVREAQ